MKRRNKKVLEEAVSQAKGRRERAISFYNLGLFHDNNGREAEAIPNYEKALHLGLDRDTKAKARTWLASSLSKTGRPKEAMQAAIKAGSLASDQKLRDFISGLKRRIEKSAR